MIAPVEQEKLYGVVLKFAIILARLFLEPIQIALTVDSKMKYNRQNLDYLLLIGITSLQLCLVKMYSNAIAPNI
jgi:hypothetical protein